MSRQHFSFEATATLAADPEKRVTTGGLAILSLRLVTNQPKKVGDKWETVPFWWRTTLWGKAADRMEKILEKGMSIYLRGKVSERKYTNKNNEEVTTVDYEADPTSIEITSWPKGSTPRARATPSDDAIAPPPEEGSVGDIVKGIEDDDLPF